MNGGVDREAAREFSDTNPFAPERLMAIYDIFSELDKNRNGMIDEFEMAVRNLMLHEFSCMNDFSA